MKSLSVKFILSFLAIASLFTACKDDEESLTECEEVKERLDPVIADAEAAFADYFTTAGNKVEDPGFASNSITPSGSATSNGAIMGGNLWYEDWSFFDRILQGETTDIDRSSMVAGKPEVTISGKISTSTTFDSDTVYILDGFIFVDNNAELTIEAGTVVKAKAGQGSDASALIVTREGTINAVGTATDPIIFTAESDDLDGTTSASTRGLWGGVILLGEATLNSANNETAIEGIPTSETGGLYGGNNDAHSSGTMKYVSIRHTGTDIGAGNEIQGLTLGGVGSGTTLEYIESVGSVDDGYEWFGGTANASYIISVYNADDAFDYDEGWRGTVEYAIVYQDATAEGADRGGEHDGGTDPENGTPYATPVFRNVTSVGNPESRAITFRDNAGGEYHNSIFINYARGVDIELKDSDDNSYNQFDNNRLKLENNIFFNIDAGTTAAELFTISVDDECYE